MRPRLHLILPAALSSLALAALAFPASAQVFEVAGDGEMHRMDAPAPTPAPRARIAPGPATRSLIAAAAEAYDLSPALLESVAEQESGFNPAAVSPKGALGLMQLTPETARALHVDPADLRANIYGGAAYLRAQIDRFNGRLDLALAAYNAGPGAVERHGGVPPYRETQAYIAHNLDRLAARSLKPSPASGDRP